jgi:hypothetical protein
MILQILSGWTLMRGIRLALALVITIQSIIAKDWTIAILGTGFALMPLLNKGCCGTSGCGISATTKDVGTKEITYEEVR